MIINTIIIISVITTIIIPPHRPEVLAQLPLGPRRGT